MTALPTVAPSVGAQPAHDRIPRLHGTAEVPGWKMGLYGTRQLKAHDWLDGNKVELMVGQQEWTERMLPDIARAREIVNVAQYNWENDAHGRQIADALKEAASSGRGDKAPEVTTMVDRFGSHTIRGSRHPLLARKLTAEMADAGINSLVYHPPYKVNPYVRELYHPKFAIMDNVAYVAGMGFGEKYATWNDLALRIEGPAAAQAAAEFAGRMVDLGAPITPRHRALLHELFAEPTTAGDARAKIVSNRPPGRSFEATRDFFDAAAIPGGRFLTMTPYIGDPRVVDALNASAARGDDVRVVAPGPKSRNNKIQVTLSQSFYKDLHADVQMLELDEMLHAKAWLRQDAAGASRLSVGSTNLSAGSLSTYWEMSAVTDDAAAGAKYTRAFDALQDKAHRVRYSDVDTFGMQALTALRKLVNLKL